MNITIKQHDSIQSMQEWDKIQQVKQMTCAEVRRLIFKDAEPCEHVGMLDYVAQAIVECDHFTRELTDWAYMTLDK